MTIADTSLRPTPGHPGPAPAQAPAQAPPRTTDAVAADLPSGAGRNAGLDGVRAIAALLILLFHVAAIAGLLDHRGAVALLLERGDIGVAIFFALSGLLLYRPWAQAALTGAAPPLTRRYLWRRAVRILPAYWVLVAVALPLFSAEHVADPWTWLSMATLTFVYDPHPWWGGTGPIGLGHIWSLAVEVAFYLALPLIAAILTRYARRAGPDVGRRARRLLAGLAVASLATYVFTFFMYHPDFRPHFALWLPQSLTWFTIGMGIAVLAAWARAEPGPDGPVRALCRTLAFSPGLCWTAAALTYAVAAAAIGGTLAINPVEFWSAYLKLALHGLVAFFLIVPIALQPDRPTPVNTLLGGRVMRFLGEISYGLFLWQLLVIMLWYELTARRTGAGAFLLGLPVVTALTIALATASYYIIEQPVRARLASRPRWTAQPFERSPAAVADSQAL